MRIRPFFSSAIALVVLLQCSGAERDPGDDVAARVGTVEITLEELRLFAAETPALLRTDEQGIGAAKDYLQTLIDMELMILEAREQGLDQQPEFVRSWDEYYRQKLVDEYLQRKVLPEVVLSEQEIQRRFKESKWSRLLKLAHIRVETEERAQQALRELEQGRPFESVAAERSTNPETAAAGGLLQRDFIGRDDVKTLNVPMSVVEHLFALEEGAFSPPFPIGDGYEIFKVVAEKPAPNWYIGVFAKWAHMEEYEVRQRERVRELADQYHLQLDQESVALIIAEGSKARYAISHIPAPEQQRILGRYDGGHFTIKDLVDTYWTARVHHQLEFSLDGIEEFIAEYLLPIRLLYLAALEEGLDRETSVAAQTRNQRRAMLLEALKEHQVQARVDTTQASARRYYEHNLNRFMQPAETVVLEILVATQERADSLLQAIRQGGDMEKLAVTHTTRSFAKTQGGRIHLHPYERPVFGPLHDAAMEKAAIGQLQGPLKLKEGYSVFKVEQRIPPRPETFKQAASRAKYWLRKTEEHKHFEALISKLRSHYAAQVVVFEERLHNLNL